jgi:hypothetical protein
LASYIKPSKHVKLAKHVKFKVGLNLGDFGKGQPIKTNYLGKPWRPGADNGPVSIKVELEIQILLTNAFHLLTTVNIWSTYLI